MKWVQKKIKGDLFFTETYHINITEADIIWSHVPLEQRSKQSGVSVCMSILRSLVS